MIKQRILGLALSLALLGTFGLSMTARAADTASQNITVTAAVVDTLTLTLNTNAIDFGQNLNFLGQGAGAGITACTNQVETGIQGAAKLFDYSATKGAIHAFTKTLAMELVERGIRVNCVAPGPVWTPLNAADEGASEEKVSTFGSKTPLKRPAQPEEIAPAYVFFASDADSSFITGVVLPVDGGMLVT